MNNKEFILQLAYKTGYSPDRAQQLVRTLISGLTQEFEEGKSSNIADFGTFEVRKKMERIVVNPATKQRMLVPPKLSLSFKAATTLKEQLKKKGGE